MTSRAGHESRERGEGLVERELQESLLNNSTIYARVLQKLQKRGKKTGPITFPARKKEGGEKLKDGRVAVVLSREKTGLARS